MIVGFVEVGMPTLVSGTLSDIVRDQGSPLVYAVDPLTGDVFTLDRDGHVSRISPSSNQVDTVANVGGSPTDIDISSDGTTLIVTQTEVLGGGAPQITVHTVDVATRIVTNTVFTGDASEAGTTFVAATQGNSALLATTYSGDGSIPLRLLSLNDLSVSRVVAPFADNSGAQNSLLLTPTEDDRYVLVQETDNALSAMAIFDSQTGTFIADTEVARDAATSAAVNDGNADITSAGFVYNGAYGPRIYDFSFQIVQDFSDRGYISLAFSETGSLLYALTPDRRIDIIETKAWTTLQSGLLSHLVGSLANEVDRINTHSTDDTLILELDGADTPGGSTDFARAVLVDLPSILQLNFEAGTEFDDFLFGTDGADVIEGFAGTDVLEGDAGADVLDGGSGTDIASYFFSPSGVTIDLAAGTGSGGDAEGDRFISIERVIGSDYDDVLIGDANQNALFGSFGDDTLVGGAGFDSLDGGEGNDVVIVPIRRRDAQLLYLEDGSVEVVSSGFGFSYDIVTEVETIRFNDIDVNVLGPGASRPFAITDMITIFEHERQDIFLLENDFHSRGAPLQLSGAGLMTSDTTGQNIGIRFIDFTSGKYTFNSLDELDYLNYGQTDTLRGFYLLEEGATGDLAVGEIVINVVGVGGHGVSVERTGLFYEILDANTGRTVTVKSGGSPVLWFNLVGWDAIQAAADGAGGYTLLWQHTDGRYGVWNLNGNGNLVSFSDMSLAFEERFLFDFNSDGELGYVIVDIDTNGVGLRSSKANTYEIIDGSEIITLTSNGAPVGPDSFPGWQALQVGSDGAGGYTVLWQFKNTRYGIWELDGSGALTGFGDLARAAEYEDRFQFDIDGDGVFGVVATDIETTGIGLQQTNTGAYWLTDGAFTVEVTNAGAVVGPNSYPGWKALQAGSDGDGGYTVLWQFKNARYGIWELDGSGALTGLGDIARAAEYEDRFQFDIDGDGVIGVVATDIETTGVGLQQTNTGAYRLKDGALTVEITNAGDVVGPDSYPGWQALQAGSDGAGGYTVLWQFKNARYGIWELDASGALTGLGDIARAADYEDRFQFDIDGDGVLGEAPPSIEF